MRHRFCSKRVSWHWMYMLRAFLVFFFLQLVLILVSWPCLLFRVLFFSSCVILAPGPFGISPCLLGLPSSLTLSPCVLVFRSHLCIAGFQFPFAPLGVAASFLFVFLLSLAMLELRPFLPPSASLASCLVLLCIFAFVFRIVSLSGTPSLSYLPAIEWKLFGNIFVARSI